MRCSVSTATFAVLGIVLVLAATGLRVASAMNPLWLDEIWTLQLLERISSPLEIVTGIHHDNNHYLNSLGLFLTGSDRAWLIYRLPAIAAGVLTVLAGGWVTRSHGRGTQLVVMFLLSSSYLLIHYGSEARGYATAILAALLVYATLQGYQESRQWYRPVAFASCVMLGLLSHLMFVHVYVAAICWSLTVILTQPISGKRMVAELAKLHAAPLALLGLLYWTDIRHLELGGGPAYSLVPLVLQASSLSLGGPLSGWLAWSAGLLLLAGTAFGLTRVKRLARDEVMFLVIVILSPILQIVATRPPFMFVRYFLFAIVFALLLAGCSLAALARRGNLGRVTCAALLLLYAAGNMLHYGRLLEHGRGQYLAALEFMASEDPADCLTVSGDHNHGIRTLLHFYADYLRQPRRVVYYEPDHWPAEGPGWLILHQYGDRTDNPYDDEYVVDGHRFRRQRIFETAILSGWRWHCYQKQS